MNRGGPRVDRGFALSFFNPSNGHGMFYIPRSDRLPAQTEIFLECLFLNGNFC